MLRHFELRFRPAPGAVRNSTQIRGVSCTSKSDQQRRGLLRSIPFLSFFFVFLALLIHLLQEVIELGDLVRAQERPNLFASLLAHLFTLHIFLVVNRGELAVHL